MTLRVLDCLVHDHYGLEGLDHGPNGLDHGLESRGHGLDQSLKST